MLGYAQARHLGAGLLARRPSALPWSRCQGKYWEVLGPLASPSVEVGESYYSGWFKDVLAIGDLYSSSE